VRFLVLGPLEVRGEEGGLPLGGAKQRAALAILLLHANEVVSRDRLIDGVWGESPPATASSTLDTYVSRLRKVLHSDDDRGRLLTRPPGYLLEVRDGELDLQVFELLFDQGRGALKAGDPRAAADDFRDALALFNGAPLEDLGSAPFIRAEAQRLKELRLVALEERIDADLSLGRHRDLIGELQSLVARHPFRERFWAQLILALYRSGRQAEALVAFERARQRLADELGVDPSQQLQQLQQGILRQDPGLEPVRQPAHPRPGPRSLGRRWAAAMTGVVALVVLVAVLVPVVLRTNPPGAKRQSSPGTAILDASSGAETAFIPLSEANPGSFSYAAGHFWARSGDPVIFVEIDPSSGTVLKRISPTSTVGAYVVSGNDLWEVGDTTLAEVDVGLGAEVDRFALPKDPAWPGGQTGIAVADGWLWVTRAGLNEVLEMDPGTGRIVRRYARVPSPAGIAVDSGFAWTISHFSGITVLDLATGIVSPVSIPLGPLSYVAAGGGYGWVSDEAKGIVYKIGPTGDVAATYQTGEGARPMSFADGVLWVANQDVGTVTGIDGVTGATRTFSFDHPVGDVTAGDGRVMVAVEPGLTYEDRIGALQGDVAKLLVAPYQLADNDPALNRTWLAFQVEYSACADLLSHPDVAGAKGARLEPEVAASMPALSADRRTYTFTIRPGYQFSPPSNQLVTAESFRYSIERALSPKMPTDAPGPTFIGDIAGEEAFRAGTADHISGIKARDDTLAITLVKPSPNFLQRLALPFFCPVPNGTPVGVPDVGAAVPVGDQSTIPSAGPYYIADFNTGEYMILKRNPNYAGPRPHALDAIALREGIDPGLAAGRVEAGSWDGIVNLYDPLLDPTAALAKRWGPGSPAAAEGDQRYFPLPMPGVDVLAFNASRPPFSDPTVRRAVALALDRFALEGSGVIVNDIGSFRVPEMPSSQLLPPVEPGYRSGRDPYPIGTSDFAQARDLMAGRRFVAHLAVAADCAACQRSARTVKTRLAPIGIGVDIKRVKDPLAAIRTRGADLDLVETVTFQDFSDPVTFLTTMFGHDVPSSWLHLSVRLELASLGSLTGSKRVVAGGDLAWRLATTQLPATALSYQVNGEFFSPRLRCRVFPSFGYGVDLAALCIRGG
jgi:DNA-binding SARP family transcriptional activator/ABC-type transport system substrate-binding protein